MATNASGLPTRARIVLAAVILGGAAVAAWGADQVFDRGVGAYAPAAVLAALAVATWSRPLLIYRESQSEALQFDEGILLVSLLLLRPGGVVLIFAVAIGVGQAVRRRPLLRCAFNLGQLLLAVGVAVVVTSAAGKIGTTFTVAQLSAAGLGAVAFFLTSSACLTAILTTTGAASLRVAATDGLTQRLTLLAAGLVTGASAALAISAYPWAIAGLPLPFLVLRQLVSAHVDARHDRDRLLGLFDSTMSLHTSMSGDIVQGELLAAAGRHLRCPDVRLASSPPLEGGRDSLVAPVADQWLVVSGRSSGEPFDSADQRLLDALAAVGDSAISTAALFGQVRHQRQQLAAVTASLAEGVCAFDSDGVLTFANPAAAAMLGCPVQEFPVGTPEAARRPGHPAGADPGESGLAEALGVFVPEVRTCLTVGRTTTSDTVWLSRVNGSAFPASYTCAPIYDESAIVGAVLAFRDVTIQVSAERELTQRALYDQLTGLPNRRLFLDRLDHALRASQRDNAAHTVLFLDVDAFKRINDNLGHQAGDQLLRVVASRLVGLTRACDTVSRFGGDEFTVLLEGSGELRHAEALARGILATLREPIDLGDGRKVVTTASVGIAITHPLDTPDDVLHNADLAMYQAKTAGSGRLHTYDRAAMNARSAERLDIEAGLRIGMATNAVDIYYQPQVDLRTGAFPGVEALVRWRDANGRLRRPEEFIDIAESTGLILPLGLLALNEACRQASRWRSEHGLEVAVAVNLSPRQFQQPDVVGHVEAALAAAGLPAHLLSLEITETLAFSDLEQTVAILTELKALGVGLAIDDFGTGYSSLTSLKHFPVDVVKIDQVFVRDIATPADGAIVKAVIDLADVLGMTTIAEGVETAEQEASLLTLGCPTAQGYRFAPPLPEHEVTPLLLARAPRRRSNLRVLPVAHRQAAPRWPEALPAARR